MPSHFAHLLHVEDSIAAALPDFSPQSSDPVAYSCFVLGAQGPDLFYHNRRRKPSALLYGSLSHRKNYGKVVAGLVGDAVEREVPLRSRFGAFVLGYACHALLDRKLHPFINYFSDLPDDRVFPRAHAFFERIVDVLLTRSRRNTEPRQVDFRSIIDCGPTIPADVSHALISAFAGAFDRAGNDGQLEERLRNAYLDSLGFYAYTNMADHAAVSKAVKHAESERHARAMIALLHPPELPEGYDFANAAHNQWCHPCDEHDTRTSSLYDLYDEAVEQATRLLHGIAAGWEGRIPLFDSAAAATEPSVEALVGNHNLSDERRLHCARSSAAPFPLLKIADELRAYYLRE